MKKFLVTTLVAAASFFSATELSAQTKIGRVNSADIFNLMPERDSAQVKVEALAKDYSEQLEACQVEFNNKYEDYQQKASTYTDAMRQQKEKELAELQSRGQEMQRTAQTDIQNLQVSLMNPITERIEAAIAKVSKEQGVTVTFDALQTAGLVYVDEANTIDLTPLVKAELKLQ